jgi:hypothetical protein
MPQQNSETNYITLFRLAKKIKAVSSQPPEVLPFRRSFRSASLRAILAQFLPARFSLVCLISMANPSKASPDLC